MAKNEKTLGFYLSFPVPMIHVDELKEKMNLYQKMTKDELISLLLLEEYDKLVNY